GKYVFAIPDDHRLGQDCLKNLIEFMRPHDNEIFLAGARCFGAHGAGPEGKTYGFYYAYTPCIRRNLVPQLGGFYEPFYKHYYVDPDLSMRVWHNGGKVELCPDAWVEFHNEFDDLNFESNDDYAEIDFNAFFNKWHPIYGHLVNSCNEMDINIGNQYAFPGIPPEKCTRLIVFLRKRDWPALKKELESENNIRLNKDNLFNVLEDMLRHLAWSFIPTEIQQNLSKWLIKQLFTQVSFEESKVEAIFELTESQPINFNTESSNIVLAQIAMFFLIYRILKRDPEVIIENYKGISINYSSRKYYAWPCSFGGFNIRAFQSKADKFAFCELGIYQIMIKIDELMGGDSSVNWQILQDIEDYFTSSEIDLLPNDENSRLVFEELPDEICLRLMFCLRLKDWAGIERSLNNIRASSFLIRNHIPFVYYEILRSINKIPSNTVLLLSDWLWKTLYASSICIQNITEEQDNSDVRLVVHGYRNYNIVNHKGLYYGWPWSAGGFSFEKYINGFEPVAVVGESINVVKNLIDEKIGSPTLDEENQHDWIRIQQNEALITHYEVADLDNDIRMVVHGYRQYNIVYCKGLCYGWPWPAGRFSLIRYMNGFEPAAVVGKSIMAVKNLIDEKLGVPKPEEENQHDWIAVQQIEDANGIDEKYKRRVTDRIPKDERFLLIKPWSAGFWGDVHDVQSKLLLAEITNRHPIVFWGDQGCNYSVGENYNSFEQYFLPVSNYSIGDVVSDKYTYYPPTWKFFNIFQNEPTKGYSNGKHQYRDIPSFIDCEANILVTDLWQTMDQYMLWIKEDHPAYGLTEDKVFRYINNKYMKLQPDIVDEIDEFYHTYMETGPILAVHIRSGAKINEVPNLHQLNAKYPQEIDCFLKDTPSARIFLLTDNEDILEQYQQMYGDILIYTDCTRKTVNDYDLSYKIFNDRRRKGIEIIKDTYLACKCDHFIGNGHSQVSIAIRRLKIWEKDKIKLLV
ncbi:MAG: hypothetical protein PHC92_05230, partial [Syntrophomonadaceae bacterium]|nr:hypothetical protein [Syntrophomonadaceae bacterium]